MMLVKEPSPAASILNLKLVAFFVLAQQIFAEVDVGCVHWPFSLVLVDPPPL